jgi:predicted RNA binding protein with dsRBD fold (UPF0201 family)
MRARCYPTEDREKIVMAIRSLFPDAEVSGDETISASSGSIEAFAEQLRRQRIRDAARAVLRHGLDGRTTSFRINKQVSTVGKVSFAEEDHPLGDIEITIESDDIDSLIDAIAPDTRSEGTR